MNLSSPFINRPIATTLLSIGVILAGILSFKLLPTAALPEIEFPIVVVQASLSGASPENMASSVTTPLESSLSSISGMTNITSNSTSGSSQIVLQFDLARDIDGAARDVQAALDSSKANLPSTMLGLPTYKKVNPSDSPIMVLALSSDVYSIQDIFDIASSDLQQRILKVEGVGQVSTVGGALPAVRVLINIDKLNHYGISLIDLNNAITNNNVTFAKGKINLNSQSFEIITNDELFDPKDYKNIVISSVNGKVVRLSDVADVSMGVQNSYNTGSLNGKSAVFLVVYKAPGSNVVETNERIEAAFKAMKADVPDEINLGIVLNRTYTIAASLNEVEFTLVAAMLFVIIVVYLFLGNFRSVIIPGVAMVATTFGTFAIMYMLGFSLNILSMMALAIATGFVVDDAIVVLENISRYLEEGLSPKEAALKGAAEIGFTVVSISSSLIAVFIPILIMPGIIGRLFEEFAITLSVSIVVSLIISLTLTPMMCALILKPEEKKDEKIRLLDKVKLGYEKLLKLAIKHERLMLCILAFAFILNIYLFIVSPKGFFPQQDTGRIIGTMVADQNISFKALDQKLSEYVNIIKEDEAVENVIGFISGNVNTATVFIVLKQLEERKIPIWEVLNRLRIKTSHIASAAFYMQAGQDLVIGGRSANAQYQFTISGSSLDEVNYYSPLIMKEIGSIPGILDLNSDQQSKGLQSYIKIDYNKLGALGVSISDLDQVLYTAFGQNTVSTMYKSSNQYYVVTEIADNYQQNPQLLSKIYVKSNTGKMIPLSSFAKISNGSTILSVNHQSLFPCATLSFNLAPGINLNDIMRQVNQKLSNMTLPVGIQYSFQGTAQAAQSSGASEMVIIFAAIIVVYLILGILYESLIHPFTIISTLPSAGLGALLCLSLTKTDLSIVALIGIILLVGIVQKNAIMMVDFVLEIRKKENLNPEDAILKAATLRFRPILMTTMSALLGAVPMVLSSGTGSELYKPLGVAIIGGLIVSQLLTLFTTPIIYLMFEKFRSNTERN